MTWIYFTMITTLAGALQAGLPTLWWLGGLRVELLPSIVAFAALTYSQRGAATLAINIGFFQDALSAAPFGMSAVSYLATIIAVSRFREALNRELLLLQVGTGALAAVLPSLIAMLLRGVSVGNIVKVILLSAMSAALTPLVIFLLDALKLGRRPV